MTKSHIAPQRDNNPSYELPIALESTSISMNALASKEQNRLRVLVTDDTALYRRAISEILSTLEDVVVVGSAFDGEDCLGMAEKLKPDLITLDIQMPRRDGLSTLQELRKRGIDSEVVMVCSETLESANQTLSALRMGALDLILKPSGSDSIANKRNLELQLSKQLQTIRFKKSRRPLRSSGIDMSSASSASQSIRSATAT
ncbi:MAG: response regulator, partial [Pirellula sp.]